MKKKIIIKSIAVVVGIAVVVTGVLVYRSKTTSASKTQSTTKYMAAKAQKGTIAVNVESTGATTPSESHDVVSFNNGIISNITTKEGDTVKKGQVIGTIADTTTQEAVNVAQLKVQADNTNIANNKDATKADSLNLQLEQDQADLNSKNQLLSEATITSPIDGVIVTQDFKNGDTVQSGKTVATIVNMQSLEIDAAVDELDIANVKEGQKATITFDALTGKSYTGTVTKIAQIGKTTNNVTDYDVYVSVDNPDGVKIGMTGNVKIAVQSKDNVITVPLDAIKTINGKSYVMTSEPQAQTQSSNTNSSGSSSKKGNYSGRNSDATSTATQGSGASKGSNLEGMTEVTVGIENQTDAEIVSGLNEGDTVYIAIPAVSTTATNQRTSGGMSGYGGGSSFGGTSRPSTASGASATGK